MNNFTFSIKEYTSSVTPISIYPEWSYSERFNRIKEYYRTQGGQLNTYSLVSSYFEFSIPLTMINSSTMSIVTSWWNTQTNIDFTISNSISNFSYQCRINNINEPFDSFQEKNPFLYNGILQLTTI